MTGRQRWTLAAVCAATAVLLLDVTVVNVALPAIEEDLGASFDELQWVIDAYALALAGVLLATGSLADRIGRRRVFVWGLGVFTAASLLCALSWEPWLLDVARGIQGLGAAAIFSTSLALLADGFSGPQRGTALGIWGAVSGAAIAVGPLVGGALVDALGWEWIFLLNLPIGGALTAVAIGKLEERRDPRAGRVDVFGTVAFTASMFLAVLGLIRGNAEGWGSPLIAGCFGAAAVLLAAFVAWELHHDDPLLDLRLFRIPAFAGTAWVAFTQSVAIYPMFLFLAVYFQTLLGYGPFDTGLRMLPVTLALFAVAPISGKLTSRVSLRLLLVTGLVLLGAGLLLMRAVETGSDWTALLPGFLVGGFAMGLISPALAAAMVGVLPPERAGLASGINNTFRQFGIAAGIAGLGAIFEHRIGGDVSSTGLATRQAREAAEAGFVAGLDEIFLVAALVAFAGAALGALLLRPGDFRAGATAAEPLGAEA